MAKSVTEVLKEYLKAHESKHVGKYCFRAAYRSGDSPYDTSTDGGYSSRATLYIK